MFTDKEAMLFLNQTKVTHPRILLGGIATFFLVTLAFW